MKRILIASVLVFGTLIACQKPSELDEIVKSKPNSSRSSKDDGGGSGTGFYYNATLVVTKKDNKNEDIAKLFETFPGAEELYACDTGTKIGLSFLTSSSPIPSNGNQRVFALNSVQTEPITLLSGILSQFRVCSASSNPQVQCISQTEMQTKITQAFTNEGYNLASVSVSANGNIEIMIRRPDSTLASCIATVISYFN